MRNVSSNEKEIIRRLVDVFNSEGGLNVVGNVMEFGFNDKMFLEFVSAVDCQLRIKLDFLNEIDRKSGQNGLMSMKKKVYRELIITTKLFEDLEAEGLLTFLGNVDIRTIGIAEEGARYASEKIDDDRLTQKLFYYVRSQFTPSDYLVEWVRNDFITDEQRRIESQFRLNRRALYVSAASAIVAVLALVFNVIVTLSKEAGPVHDIMNEKRLDSMTVKNDSTFIRKW